MSNGRAFKKSRATTKAVQRSRKASRRAARQMQEAMAGFAKTAEGLASTIQVPTITEGPDGNLSVSMEGPDPEVEAEKEALAALGIDEAAVERVAAGFVDADA